jgi:hypothetical protein
MESPDETVVNITVLFLSDVKNIENLEARMIGVVVYSVPSMFSLQSYTPWCHFSLYRCISKIQERHDLTTACLLAQAS